MVYMSDSDRKRVFVVFGQFRVVSGALGRAVAIKRWPFRMPLASGFVRVAVAPAREGVGSA
eukprot:1347811-Alexandrium_andersonii.AAC.1